MKIKNEKIKSRRAGLKIVSKMPAPVQIKTQCRRESRVADAKLSEAEYILLSFVVQIFAKLNTSPAKIKPNDVRITAGSDCLLRDAP
jgi:hypothetical protein